MVAVKAGCRLSRLERVGFKVSGEINCESKEKVYDGGGGGGKEEEEEEEEE